MTFNGFHSMRVKRGRWSGGTPHCYFNQPSLMFSINMGTFYKMPFERRDSGN